MTRHKLNDLRVGENYSASELDSFVSSSDVVIISSNDSQLFSDPEREYKVVHQFNGFFEHSSENGEKYFRDKPAFLVEKV
ncbi:MULTISPECIES: hypothetical protein [Sediminibacillus]|uniref:hypothetical protein n=1 Tax=Sediminibacillus TaxID=482460 RepID=UPI00041DBA36|nr:hypothetical protein [Sediminibacillus terrae]